MLRITVKVGDSLWYYSQLFQVPTRLLIDSNRQINPYQLSFGQTIEIAGFVISDNHTNLGYIMVNCNSNKPASRCNSTYESRYKSRTRYKLVYPISEPEAVAMLELTY